MATLREYYEKDFDHTIRFHVTLPYEGDQIEASFLYDFTSYSVFLSCYFPNILIKAKYLSGFISTLTTNVKATFQHTIQLPSIKGFHGEMHFRNNGNNVEIQNRMWGDPNWTSSSNFTRSVRVYLYLEGDLTEVEMKALYQQAEKLGINVQFRNRHYQRMRDQNEAPYAFISHDSRDKLTVAKEIATGLQKRLCPVWYDEFSLNVGDNLRDSIENGIKKCKKCILIISPNLIGNQGWTKAEFDAVFTRQILQKENLFLPIWYNVTKEEVYNYSPGLLNILGLNYNELGPQEICRRLSGVLNI